MTLRFTQRECTPKMKAIVQDVYGSADVVELGDIGQPPIGDEEVLV